MKNISNNGMNSVSTNQQDNKQYNVIINQNSTFNQDNSINIMLDGTFPYFQNYNNYQPNETEPNKNQMYPLYLEKQSIQEKSEQKKSEIKEESKEKIHTPKHKSKKKHQYSPKHRQKKENKGHKSKIKASSIDDTQKTQINFKNYQHENLFNTESFMDMNALDDDKFEGKEGFFPDIDEEEAQPEELPPNNNMMDITNEESVFTIRLEENLN